MDLRGVQAGFPRGRRVNRACKRSERVPQHNLWPDDILSPVRAEPIHDRIMAKALRKYRGVDLERRRATFGEIYVWLYRRYDDLLGELTAMPHGFWAATARKMALGETRSKSGRVPSADAVQKAWVKVSLHYPEDTERFVAAREANTGHVSRRHKGWVPTSTLPPQSPVALIRTAKLTDT